MVTKKIHFCRLGQIGIFSALLLLLSCCSSFDSIGLSGYVYTNTRRPYTDDLHDTPVVLSQSDGTVIKIQEPFSGMGMYAEFNTNAIGDLAKKYNMKKVYYAELKTFDLLGIWRENKLYIYGE